MRRTIAALAMLWLGCVGGWAHPVDLGRLQVVERDREIAFTLQLSATAMSGIAVIDADKLTPEQAPQVARAAWLNTLGQATVVRGGAACAWQHPQLTGGDPVQLTVAARCPTDGAWSLALPFVNQAPATFQLLVKEDSPGGVRESVVTAADRQITGGAAGREGWSAFVLMGVQHIGAWPTEWWGDPSGGQGLHLPDGIDHILFLVALILGGGGLLLQMKTVTGFTLGHSVTLALAALGLVAVPTRVVESAIAASIVYVAVESLLQKRPRDRWPLAFAFGMVHGLGFASALAALHLQRGQRLGALVGFNVGVELGQLVILCLISPVLLGVRHLPWAKRALIPASLVGIAAMGCVWFVRRAFAIG